MRTALWKLTQLPPSDAKRVEIRGRHFHTFRTAGLEIVGRFPQLLGFLGKNPQHSTMRPPPDIPPRKRRRKNRKNTNNGMVYSTRKIETLTRETNIPGGTQNGGRPPWLSIRYRQNRMVMFKGSLIHYGKSEGFAGHLDVTISFPVCFWRKFTWTMAMKSPVSLTSPAEFRRRCKRRSLSLSMELSKITPTTR